MSSNNGSGNGSGNGNGSGSGNGNGRRGPPPWSNAPDHVTERDDGSVSVGKTSREERLEQAIDADDQQDRIEAKLDLLLSELDIDA